MTFVAQLGTSGLELAAMIGGVGVVAVGTRAIGHGRVPVATAPQRVEDIGVAGVA